MEFETIHFELNSDIGFLKINRPSSLNALNGQVLQELEHCLSDLPKKMRCLVVTGAGDKSFVAGADIKEMMGLNREQALKMSQQGQGVFNRLESLRTPVIAAVNGFALGGGFELALSCDFILASEKAKFGLPEVSLGLIPGYGGTQRLARYIGKGNARLITLTGDMFTAEEMCKWGVVSRVYKHEELLAEAQKFAEKILSRAPLALSLAKRSINEGYDMSQYEGLKHEAELFADTFKTKDHLEGIQAFIEKRKPIFIGE